MKFKTRRGNLVEDGLGGAIETAHMFAYSEYDKMDVIMKVLMALADTLPVDAQVALAEQLGYEPVEEE
jgi:hypothetical protein